MLYYVNSQFEYFSFFKLIITFDYSNNTTPYKTSSLSFQYSNLQGLGTNHSSMINVTATIQDYDLIIKYLDVRKNDSNIEDLVQRLNEFKLRYSLNTIPLEDYQLYVNKIKLEAKVLNRSLINFKAF